MRLTLYSPGPGSCERGNRHIALRSSGPLTGATRSIRKPLFPSGIRHCRSCLAGTKRARCCLCCRSLCCCTSESAPFGAGLAASPGMPCFPEAEFPGPISSHPRFLRWWVGAALPLPPYPVSVPSGLCITCCPKAGAKEDAPCSLLPLL